MRINLINFLPFLCHFEFEFCSIVFRGFANLFLLLLHFLSLVTARTRCPRGRRMILFAAQMLQRCVRGRGRSSLRASVSVWSPFLQCVAQHQHQAHTHTRPPTNQPIAAVARLDLFTFQYSNTNRHLKCTQDTRVNDIVRATKSLYCDTKCCVQDENRIQTSDRRRAVNVNNER